MNRQSRRKYLQLQRRRRTHITHQVSRVKRGTQVGMTRGAQQTSPQPPHSRLKGAPPSSSVSGKVAERPPMAVAKEPAVQPPPRQVQPPRTSIPVAVVASPVASEASGSWLWRLPLYGMRLLITGAGVAAIAGTVLAILHPEQKVPITEVLAPEPVPSEAATTAATEPSVRVAAGRVPQLQAGRELTDIKTQVEALAAAQSDLTPGLFFYSLDSGHFLNLAGDQAFSAASTIKIPILIAFFQAVDAGQVRLDEPLVMRPDLIASEAGVIQYDPPNSEYPALEVADLMITISDNTATNMLIDRLGGAAVLNQRFQSWGLQHTAIQNLLPDLEGTNTVSPKDLATLFLRLGEGELLSEASRSQALDIMQRTVTDTLLPQGLSEGATIAHKTGDIGSVVGDAGLIQTANGQRYVGAVMVARPHNDSRAQELIRQISRLTYAHFNQVSSPSVPSQEN